MSIEYQLQLARIRDAAALTALGSLIRLIPYGEPQMTGEEIVRDAFDMAELFVAEHARRYGPMAPVEQRSEEEKAGDH